MDADGETTQVCGRFAPVCVSDFSGRVFARSNPGRRSARGSYNFPAASLVLIVLARRDILALFHSARVRQTIGGFSFLVIWIVLQDLPGGDGMRETEGQWNSLGDHFFADPKYLMCT
jgi:hypothetical protein